MKVFILLLFFSISLMSYAQVIEKEKATSKEALKSHLHKINYMSANVRYGYGFTNSKFTSNSTWDSDGSTTMFYGVGYNFVMKNSIGFDLQYTSTNASHSFSNAGPSFTTGFNTMGLEVGVKKLIPTKPDDTFFFRGALGYNFLVRPKGEGSFANEFYTYSISTSGSSMYLTPELGYQIRFDSRKSMVDISAFYRYGLGAAASVNMNYIDKGSKNETATAELTGSYFGLALRYSYLFRGYKKLSGTRQAPNKRF